MAELRLEVFGGCSSLVSILLTCCCKGHACALLMHAHSVTHLQAMPRGLQLGTSAAWHVVQQQHCEHWPTVCRLTWRNSCRSGAAPSREA